jgi:hypothetical protein
VHSMMVNFHKLDQSQKLMKMEQQSEKNLNNY